MKVTVDRKCSHKRCKRRMHLECDGHRIAYIGGGIYTLSWQYEVKYAGSRLLHHRSMSRDTDRAGAERFAKKWGCKMPEVKS